MHPAILSGAITALRFVADKFGELTWAIYRNCIWNRIWNNLTSRYSRPKHNVCLTETSVTKHNNCPFHQGECCSTPHRSCLIFPDSHDLCRSCSWNGPFYHDCVSYYLCIIHSINSLIQSCSHCNNCKEHRAQRILWHQIIWQLNIRL